jgi:glycosyltransferase involved in cell wall biosynthesis
MLARGIRASGHQVRVIGVCHPDYAGRTHEFDDGVEVWRQHEPRVRGGWVAARWRLFSTVSAWCRKGEVDLVELPDWQGIGAGWPALPVPLVLRLHGSETYFAVETGRRPKRLARFLEAMALDRADFVCSVSRYTATRTREIFGLRRDIDAVLLNPIQVPAPAPGAVRTRHEVVFTGTLTAKKGVLSLVEAWPLVRARCPDAHLHLFGRDGVSAGGGSMRAFLEARLPAADRPSVTFHAHTDRETLFAYLRRARVAVFPSYAEAFPIAPLEAMACRCPTIASVRGAGRELLEHGREGLLVEPGDPPVIASAIASVLSNDELAAALGEKGWLRVSAAFSLERLRERNLAFYQDCLDRFANRHAGRAPAHAHAQL